MGAGCSLSAFHGGPWLACPEAPGPHLHCPCPGQKLMVGRIALPLPTSQRVHEDVQMEAVPATPGAACGHVAVCWPRSSRSQTSSTC